MAYKSFPSPDENEDQLLPGEPGNIAHRRQAWHEVKHYPEDLIREENRYKKEKFRKLNPPEKASGGSSKKSEPKEQRFFSSDPIKDKIMYAYWPLLQDGFASAAPVSGFFDILPAYSYLTVIIQRYYDLEKGHFDWLGSDITRFERNFLIENFGVVLPRWVGKDESWEDFVTKIGTNEKATNLIDVKELKTYLGMSEQRPLSLKSLPLNITKNENAGDNFWNPCALIDKENQYKNDKFKKLNHGINGVFSSKPQKDKIMRDYWSPLVKGFEAAKVAKDSNMTSYKVAELYVIPIIQRYYDIQRGHFDAGSSINKFERNHLFVKFGIKLPESVAKDESWNTFVGKITAAGPTFLTDPLQAELLKKENFPLSEKGPALTINTKTNGTSAYHENNSEVEDDPSSYSPGRGGPRRQHKYP